MLQYFISVEESTLLWIQNSMRNEILTPIFKGITILGNGGFFLILCSVILFISKKTRNIGIMSLVAIIFSVLIDDVILKNLIARKRPYEVISGLTSLIGDKNDFSFPSGYTGSSFAAAVVMFRGLPKKIGVPTLIIAFLIGVSRLYVGVNYPSDVFCGSIIGTGIALLTYLLGNDIYREENIRRQVL